METETISQRSAWAYREYAHSEFAKVYKIPEASEISVSFFDGYQSDVIDTVKSISEAIEEGEVIFAYYIPEQDIGDAIQSGHTVVVSGHHVIKLFDK